MECTNKIKFEGLRGVCFDLPPHELLPTGHWAFKILPVSPAWIQSNKYRLRVALGTRTDPFASDRKSLLFIHIPKNAGTSVARSLFGVDANLLGHYSAQFFRRLNSKKYEQFLKVAVVRDPIERFVSAVNYNRFTSKVSANRSFAEKCLNFENLSELAQALDHDRELFKQVTNHMHFRRQVGYVCDPSGKVMVDFLLSMKSLHAGIEELGRVLGRDISLAHANVSPPNRDGFEMSSALRDFYAPDFELWDRVSQSESGFVWLNDSYLRE